MNKTLSRTLTVLSIITIIVFSIGSLRGQFQEGESDTNQVDSPAQLYPVATEKIVQATNEFRQENDLQAVSVNPELKKAAAKFAKFMSVEDKYGHTADGRRPSARAEEAGYDYCVVRENIAYRLDTTEPTANSLGKFFLEGWRESEEHRKNMLASHITETGVAVASDDGQTFFAVQMFGRPESAKYEIEITNEADVERTVVFRAEGNRDDIKVPPRVVLTMSRCLPSTVELPAVKDSNAKESGLGKRLEINDSSNLVIMRSEDSGKVVLIRADKAAGTGDVNDGQ